MKNSSPPDGLLLCCGINSSPSSSRSVSGTMQGFGRTFKRINASVTAKQKTAAPPNHAEIWRYSSPSLLDSLSPAALKVKPINNRGKAGIEHKIPSGKNIEDTYVHFFVSVICKDYFQTWGNILNTQAKAHGKWYAKPVSLHFHLLRRHPPLMHHCLHPIGKRLPFWKPWGEIFQPAGGGGRSFQSSLSALPKACEERHAYPLASWFLWRMPGSHYSRRQMESVPTVDHHHHQNPCVILCFLQSSRMRSASSCSRMAQVQAS